jgi:hypothetical protein
VLELESRKPQPARNRVRRRHVTDIVRRRDDPEKKVN